MKKWLLIMLLLIAWRGILSAQEMPVPVEIQHKLLTKILTFDRSLRSRAGDTLRIGIIYQKFYRTSLNIETEFLKIGSESGVQEIEGIPLSYVPLPLHSVSRLDTMVLRNTFDVIYVTPLRGIDISSLSSVLHRANIVTVTGVPEYLNEGMCIGIDSKGGYPEIVIRLDLAKGMGVDFTSQLLKLSRIIR